jgi:hypothetical protein
MMMLLASSIIPLLVVAILIFLIHSMPRVQNIVLNIQDRLSILLFIYVPLGFLSLIIVLYRNLL